jgi:uncharacterized membrane protein YqhA
MARKLIARLIVLVLLGVVTGYAVGKSLAADAAKGQTLTLKEYIADFESHKQDLIKSKMPMAMAVFVGVLMIVVVFGIYELLVLAVDKGLQLADQRRGVTYS